MPSTLADADDEAAQEGSLRLVLVSARLPCTFKVNEAGKVVRSASHPAFASGNVMARGLWVGWPGDPVALGDQLNVAETELGRIGLVPLHLSHDRFQAFCNIFCRGTLRPLFHSVVEKADMVQAGWDVYCAVNDAFASAICARIGRADLVWVHDYQLCLVPQLVRLQNARAQLCIFLHVPFPLAVVLSAFPWHAELLRGILGADVVAFCDAPSLGNFCVATQRIVGAELAGADAIRYEGRVIKIGIFPHGMGPHHFAELASADVVHNP
jgi:trehalose 6-phosphate synthase/phosphatase